MTILVPDEGEVRLLERAIGTVVPTTTDLTVKLFVNDYTPVAATTGTDFTEMSTNDYVAKTVDIDGTPEVTITSETDPAGGDMAQAAFDEIVWTFDDTGGANTIYGYWVEDEDGEVLFAERFAEERVVGENGDQLLLTINFTNRSRP
jgi:hypothetical protein